MYPPRVNGTGPEPYLMQAADGGDTTYPMATLFVSRGLRNVGDSSLYRNCDTKLVQYWVMLSQLARTLWRFRVKWERMMNELYACNERITL